mmetsp:Transcript_107560/g.304162  ORF Transcript_107560/g.304162 Transcript_107560/m.304162 type:complete len:281 (-) Transcript_107560:40-882(-)
MPRVSVIGFSGHVYIDARELEEGSTVGALRAAAREAMGINGPGLEVRLVSGTAVLKEDEQSIADAGILDTSVVVATIEDIISGMREMTDLPTYAGKNVAEAASMGAWHDVVRLVEENTDLNAVHDFGYSALLHLASVPHATPKTAPLDPFAASQLMRWLLMRGANPMSLCSNRKCALHVWGKYGGSLEQGQVLLDFGLDVNHPMNGGYTPLWYVRNYKRPAPGGSTSTAGVHQAEARARATRGAADEAPAAVPGEEPLWLLAERMLIERGAEQHPDNFDY